MTPAARVNVLIVDDHAIVREGLRMFLTEEPTSIEVVGEASDGIEGAALAERLRPDVILLDLLMPRMGGIDVIHRLREAGVPSRVVVLTSFAADHQVRDALQAGAIGYLLKDVGRADLVAAIHAAAAGRATLHPEAQQQLIQQLAAPQPSRLELLTARERDVLDLIADGASNKRIAQTLGIGVGTVKGYVSAILEKLEVADRTQAALYTVRHTRDVV